MKTSHPRTTPTTTTSPVEPWTRATFLAAIPSILVGGYLFVTISVLMLQGAEDEWGIGPFFLGVGAVLVVVPLTAIGLALHGRETEHRSGRRSVWSVLGLVLATIAALPSVMLILLFR